MKRVVILHGTSGVDLSRCAKKLLDALRPGVRAELADVEVPIKSSQNAERMTDVVWGTTRDAMTSFVWPEAARGCLQRLLSSEADIGILVCHLVYYRGRTHEFYEPGDLAQIYKEEWAKTRNIKDTSPPPLLVLTLIDDIYDIFHRLTVKDEVFDLLRFINDEYRRKEQKGELPIAPDPQYVIAFEQMAATMLRILDWRSREVSAGDALARRSGGRSYLVAIKHPVQSVCNLIRSECGLSNLEFCLAYLSHPITRPRKLQKKSQDGEWLDFVRQFHVFVLASGQSQANGFRTILFMPTAIDELRIAEPESPSDPPIFPTLHRRWPLFSEVGEELLYELPFGYVSYDEFERGVLLEGIFNPVGSRRDVDAFGRVTLSKYATNAAEVPGRLSKEAKYQVNGLLATIRQQVLAQIAFRDHTLVRQCGRFLLYRPLFGEGVISGGVGAELKNWGDITQHSLKLSSQGSPVPWPWGPAVFIHDKVDLDALTPQVRNLTNNVATR